MVKFSNKVFKIQKSCKKNLQKKKKSFLNF